MFFKKKSAREKTFFLLLGLLIIILIYSLYTFSGVKNTAELVIEHIDEIFSTNKENVILKEHIIHLEPIKSEIESYKSDNTDLRELIKMNNYINEKLKYQTKVETVLKRDYDKWFDELVITSNNSYSKGIVMSSKGLIGKIVNDDDDENIQTVQLITGELNNVAGSVQNAENIHGIIGGYDKDTGFLQMKYIPNNQNDQEKILGKNIITSGKGGIYPYGLLVGKVKEIIVSDFGLNKVLLIEPSANFSAISDVIVIPD